MALCKPLIYRQRLPSPAIHKFYLAFIRLRSEFCSAVWSGASTNICCQLERNPTASGPRPDLWPTSTRGSTTGENQPTNPGLASTGPSSHHSTAWSRPRLCANFLSLYLLAVSTLFVLDTVSNFLLLHLSITCRPSCVCLFLSGIPFHLMSCLVLILVLLWPVSTVSLLLIVSLLVCNCLCLV